MAAEIIAIANQKGGVGKTTTNVNLSACVAARDKKVLTIDLDPQGNTTSGLGIPKKSVEKSTYEIMIDNFPIEKAILQTQMPNLYLLPSSVRLAGAEIEMVSMLAREHILTKAIQNARQWFDYIFIDCPPSLGLLTVNALTATDKVLVPIQCEYYALEGLTQLMNTVDLVRKHLNPSIDVEGVVLTMYDSRTNLSFQVVEEVKKFFKSKVYNTVIPRNVRLGEAPSFGKPILLYDPACAGAIAYNELTQEFLSGGGAA